jgi:hypothetical protein
MLTYLLMGYVFNRLLSETLACRTSEALIPSLCQLQSASSRIHYRRKAVRGSLFGIQHASH